MEQIKTAKIEITLKNGQKISLERFGNELICVNPPPQFNKEDKEYIKLKKELFLIIFGNL